MNDFRVLQPCTKLRSELEPRGDNLLWCADCDHAVLDLKRLSRSEISRQFESGARVCGIVERGADGRALTADDLGWFGSARRRFLAALLSPAAAALGWAGYGTVQGRVTRLDGTPRRDVRVLLDAPGKPRETRPNAYGYYWFNFVREGQWKLRVILEDQAPFELQLNGVVDAGGTATAEPVLADPLRSAAAATIAAARISGEIRDPTEAIIPRAKVTAIDFGTNEPAAMIDSDEAGRFTLGLAPGWHWLRIEREGFRTRRIALSVPREQREVGLAPITLEIGEITMGVFIETAPPGRGKRRGRPRP